MGRVYFGFDHCRSPWPVPQNYEQRRKYKEGRLGFTGENYRCVTSLFFETLNEKKIQFGKSCYYSFVEKYDWGTISRLSSPFRIWVSQEEAYQKCLENGECKKQLQALLAKGYILIEEAKL